MERKEGEGRSVIPFKTVHCYDLKGFLNVWYLNYIPLLCGMHTIF